MSRELECRSFAFVWDKNSKWITICRYSNTRMYSYRAGIARPSKIERKPVRSIQGCNQSCTLSCCTIAGGLFDRLLMNLTIFIHELACICICAFSDPDCLFCLFWRDCVLVDVILLILELPCNFRVTQFSDRFLVDSADTDRKLSISAFFIPRTFPFIARCAIEWKESIPLRRCCVRVYVEVVERTPL